MWKQKANKKLSCGSLVIDIPIFSTFERGREFSNFPYSVLITQACDLESHSEVLSSKREDDSNGKSESLYNRQLITQVLLLPAFEEESFKIGTHFHKQYGKILQSINAGVFSRIKTNQDLRYHYVKSTIENIPSLVIDFKHYFTTPIEIAEEWYETSAEPLYELEFSHITDIADRFAHYLQRVAV